MRSGVGRRPRRDNVVRAVQFAEEIPIPALRVTDRSVTSRGGGERAMSGPVERKKKMVLRSSGVTTTTDRGGGGGGGDAVIAKPPRHGSIVYP